MVNAGSNGLLVGLQVFGTLFIVLLAFLGMTAWIVKRIDAVAQRLGDGLQAMGERIARMEGKLDSKADK